MGVDGDVTMTNLKSATGIVDDRLSAHHPNGAGNITAMGDFFVPGLGAFQDVDGDTLQEFVPEWIEIAAPSQDNADSQDPADPALDIGDLFKIKVQLHDRPAPGGYPDYDDNNSIIVGDYWDQLVGNGIQFILNGCTISTQTLDKTNNEIILELEVTGFDFVSAKVEMDHDGGYNKDAVHYDSGLVNIAYQNADVQSSTPAIGTNDAGGTFKALAADNNSYRPDLDKYEPQGNVTGYYIKWGDGQNESWTTGTGTPSHSYFSTGNYNITVEQYTNGGETDPSNNPENDSVSYSITVESESGQV